MPISEIDAIFASKGKPPAAPPKASSSSSALPEKKKRKKKSKDKQADNDKSAKRKRDDADAEDAPPSKPPKRQVPETVFDPSAGLSSAKKPQPAKADKSAASGVKQKKPKKDREDEDRFKDSRGTGPRRRTEEGFMIYKEDELGIADSGGDTPLCPFDCQCCF